MQKDAGGRKLNHKHDKAYYDAAAQEFENELNQGKFSIEILENKGPDRRKKEAADAKAFLAHLNSEDFKLFNKRIARHATTFS